MKHISKLYLIIIFIVLLGFSLSIIFFARESQKDKFLDLRHHIIQDFRKFLVYENENLLTFSLALSENGALKNAIIDDNSQKGYEILSQISQRFRKYTTIKTLRIQIFDNDFFIFAQSWGNSSIGMPIWWFRDDLDKFKYNKRPKVGIETGRMLTLKATVPIQNGKKYIGYLEVIKFVDEFTKTLRKKGIELFVLMDNRYRKQASLMKEYPFLDKYIIANRNFNTIIKTKSQNINWKELEKIGYIYKDKLFYILEPMYNAEKETIGEYLIVLDQKTLTKYQKNYQDISFWTRLRDDDIYEVVKIWENPTQSYKSISDKNLIELIHRLNPKDKQEMSKKAREILNRYNKQELINIILDNSYQTPKRGVIE